MNDTAANKAVDRLMKNFTFKAQRELEKVVRAAVTNGKLRAGEPISVSVTLAAAKIDLNVTIFSKIEI